MTSDASQSRVAAMAEPDPRQMTTAEIRTELAAYFSKPENSRRSQESTHHVDIESLFDRAESAQQGRLELVGRGINVSLDVNLHGHLWLLRLYAGKDENGAYLPPDEWALNQHGKDRTIHSFNLLTAKRPSRQFGDLVGDYFGVRSARIHCLTVYAAAAAIDDYMAYWQKTSEVVWCGARVLTLHEDGFLPRLAIAYRTTRPHSRIEEVLGLTEESLLVAVARLGWRSANELDWARWQTSVVEAGGNELPPLTDLRNEIIKFYRLNDPAEILEREATASREREDESARKARIAAEQRDAVRAILALHDCRSGKDWFKPVAQLLGKRTQHVRPWLERHLPEEFERIFGPQSRGGVTE